MYNLFIPLNYGPPMMIPFNVVYDLIGLCMLCVLINVAVSWVTTMGARVPLYNPIIRRIMNISGYLTAPIGRMVRPVRLGHALLDLSPFIVLVGLGLIQSLVFNIGRNLT
jgi:uncharacterized protein YggT (Ycf19 family)